MRGERPGRKSGFDIGNSDLFQMDQCRGVVVSSAIFGIFLYTHDTFVYIYMCGVFNDLCFTGAYDLIQQPMNISETSKQNVCFFMFIDEQTEKFMRNLSYLDDSKKIGLWRVIVIHNLPYTDPRRNGKVK